MSEYTEVLIQSLENLVPYDAYRSPFVDGFARFSVNFPSGSPFGIGCTFPRSTQFTFQITDRTAQLFLIENGTPVAVPRQTLRSLPWAAIEETRLPIESGELEITATHVFASEDRLVSEFVFHNHAQTTLHLEPRWLGLVPGDIYTNRRHLDEFEGMNTRQRATFIEPVENGIRCGLRVEEGAPDLPQPALRLYRPAAPLPCWIGESPYYASAGDDDSFSAAAGKSGFYALNHDETLVLAPGTAKSFQFVMDVAIAYHAAPTIDWPDPVDEPYDIVALLETRKATFTQMLQPKSLPLASAPALQEQVARARYALLRNGIRGGSGEFGDHIASLCTADASGFTTSFFWDTLFSAVAIADFHPEYARGAIHTAFVRQSDRDGSSPENKYNYPIPHRINRQAPQAPVASWAVREYLKIHKDKGFLESIYPHLVANHRYWTEYADRDRDGLAEWTWSGQTADNSPLFDCYAGSNQYGCNWLPPVASVSLNCFLYRDASILAEFADRLHREDERTTWLAQRDALFDRFMAICYVENEKRFWDFNHATSTHRRIKTFYMFWPLFAGMPIPEETTKDLIENALLDEKQFFGPIPFPSVAYSEPTYDPTGYWRGRAWPHISYWLLCVLARYGYTRQAVEAGKRIVSWYTHHAGFRENIATDPTLSEPGGCYDYNWGSAAFCLIASERFLHI